MHRLCPEIRAGVHTGECELDGDRVSGIAVHVGARIAELAGPGEVLVSGTVTDLVPGRGFGSGSAIPPGSRESRASGDSTRSFLCRRTLCRPR
jgi:class 3 adenylate cyclase